MKMPAAAAKSLQSCPTLCDPIDGSPPGSPVPGILQARVLEWGAISFSNAWKWKVKVKSLSCVRLLATPWTAAYQAPPSMGFSRQEYWSGVPLPSLSTFPSWSEFMFLTNTLPLTSPHSSNRGARMCRQWVSAPSEEIFLCLLKETFSWTLSFLKPLKLSCGCGVQCIWAMKKHQWITVWLRAYPTFYMCNCNSAM